MAKQIIAPDGYIPLPNERAIFLAGGITGCVDWQWGMWEALKDIPRLVVYNPRRASFEPSGGETHA